VAHSGSTPEIEGFILALQEQAVFTNLIIFTTCRPNITVVFPNDQKAFLVDIAIPEDSRLSSEKQTSYTDG